MPQPHNPDSHRSTVPRFLARLLCLPLAALLLVGCGTIAGGPDPKASESTETSSAAYLLTIELRPQDTRSQVEENYGGTALVWKPGDFAVLTLDSVPSCGDCAAFTTLGASQAIEPNEDGFEGGGKIVGMNGTSTIWSGGTSTIWSGGTSTIWSGGTSTIWSGGTSTIWSGGEFSWMPENTGLWQQIALEQGHLLAPNLGYGVKVAVIDTGVDLDHPALREALAPAAEWRDFRDDDDRPDEEGELFVDAGNGHGTSVAGIIRQVAPRATILPLRVLGPDGNGEAADLVEAIVWAVDHGADVINLSLGASNTLQAVDAALRYAAENGVFVVSSTGDTSNGEKKVTYPASRSHLGRQAPFLLSVTSVDSQDAKSSFATYHHNKVELAAPGEAVFGPAPEERQVPWSGTSMSAPMASGGLALALGETLNVPRASLADELMAHSTNIYQDGLNEEYVGQLGDGRLDVAGFLGQVVRSTTLNSD
jgi:thermitase